MRLSLATFLAIVTVGCASTAFADETIQGSYVVARTHPSGLIIWDSAPAMAQIVKDKASDADANALLQRDALLIIAKTSAQFATAKEVKVRIVYSKTGDINPAYGSATFTGIERYAEVTLDHAQIATDADHWKEAAAGTGALPAFSAPKIIGALPPR